MTRTGTDIQFAAELLCNGNVVAIPTETVYGLAANALNKEAVAAIFRIKNRPDFDPLIVHTHSIQEVNKWVSILPPKAEMLAKKFWPGPLTLVLPKSDLIPYEVTSGLDTVGIRIPDHPLTLRLLQAVNFPLAAPSANPFGYVSPTNAQHVEDQLGELIPYILDGGSCTVGIESTIVSFADEKPVILRKGLISREMIEETIGPVDMHIHSSSNPKAPGMLASHYAPKTRVVIADASPLTDASKTGYIAFAAAHRHIPADRQVILSPKADLYEAARSLYAALRRLDQKHLDRILIEKVPETGIGAAINDRIMRAANG